MQLGEQELKTEMCAHFLETLKRVLYEQGFIDLFSYHFWFYMSILYLKLPICLWFKCSSNIERLKLKMIVSYSIS